MLQMLSGHTFKDFIKLNSNSTINVIFDSIEREKLITKQEEIDEWIESINNEVLHE